MTYEDILNKFFEQFQRSIAEGEITEIAYNTWIKVIRIIKIENNTIYIDVPTVMHETSINGNYTELIKKNFYNVLGYETDLVIEIADNTFYSPQNVKIEKFVDKNYDLTFDTFIIGHSNEFAYAACNAVAETCIKASEGGRIDNTYNPLFIYGPSGMGKTHLLNAIYHKITTQTDKNVIIITGEAFANDLIDHIAKKNTLDFKQKYRNADVLLIDDIHFIAGKDSTQEEFFYTFNELYEKGKQIVITSDRPPKDIKTLEERIRTRFEWGMLADISAPEYETRVAIIRRKASLMQFNIPDDVVDCIANRLKTNIRQLEGCVKKLKAAQFLVGTPPTMIQAQNVIREILSDDAPTPVSIERVIGDVASVYGVNSDDIKSKKRSSQISTARKVCAYIIKQVMGLSHKQIGAELGGKDHSTIVYYIDEVTKTMQEDDHTREIIEDIINNLQNM